MYLQTQKKNVDGCVLLTWRISQKKKKKEVEVDISKQECWDRTEILWKSPELTIAVYQNYNSCNVEKPYLVLFLSFCIVLNKVFSKTESSWYIICLIHASLPAGRFFFSKCDEIWVEYEVLQKRNSHLFCPIKLMVLPITEGFVLKETYSCCNTATSLLVCACTAAVVNAQLFQKVSD